MEGAESRIEEYTKTNYSNCVVTIYSFETVYKAKTLTEFLE